MLTVSFHTLGCKLNFAETSIIGRQFIDRGYTPVAFGQPADVCVINTCSVTERADRECRQMIRRATRTSPGALIVVTGCYAQLAPEEAASIKGVDVVLGSREKFEIFEYLGGLEKKLYPSVFVSPIESTDSFGPASSTDVGGRTRAFLKIQDGCDYHCTFCTIPRARGASRSQTIEATLTQAREIVERGYQEIVLTGVNVGDYGKATGSDLLQLLRALSRVAGLRRIRVSSIEPNLLTDDIIELVAATEVLCKHFHIPLQSGSDAILRRMRRRYTTELYRNRVERIRRRIPHCGIGVDVIVGFPGETQALFDETERFLADLPLSYLHVFTYSERPNTPAAALDGQVEPRIRFRRNEMLRILGQKKKDAFSSNLVGKTVSVLFEADGERGMRYGLTDTYVRVGVPLEEAQENTIRCVQIVDARSGLCVGRVVREAVPA